MLNIFNEYKENIVAICNQQFDGLSDSILSNLTVDLPKDQSHGDMASNAAMVLAKPLKSNPREIAGKIASSLESDSNIASVDIAGPGFINISFNDSFWHNIIGKVNKLGAEYGRSSLGEGRKVNIEYVSANPTGPMHIGHARNAIVGDAIANLLLEVGYNVTKEYYVNDAGVQVGVLSKSAFLRYKEIFSDYEIEIPEGYYPGEYLIDIAKEFADIHGDKFINQDDYPIELREFALDKIMNIIKQDLGQLGVNHDIFTSEKELHEQNLIEKSIKRLDDLGLMYRGILEPPKGKKPDDWEEREQLLFKATNFGDDVDRPVQKSDGSYTYFAADIAYHWDKISRGFDDLVMVLGADHGGYVKRLKSVVKALSSDKVDMNILLSQLVKIMENGEPVKMSKRAGNFILMSEVLDKVGKDVLRFMMLTRKSDAPLDFDLVKVLETTKENPVFYVQYASARACSIIRSAEELGVDIKDDNVDLNILSDAKEFELIKKIAEYPKIVEAAAIHKEPHRISFYLYDLANLFHQLWSLGKDQGWKFIDVDDLGSTKARLQLVKATKSVIWNGLNIIAVDPVEKM